MDSVLRLILTAVAAMTLCLGSASVSAQFTELQKLALPDGEGLAGDLLGIRVQINGDVVVVGSFGDDIGSNEDQGSACIFRNVGGTWVKEAVLTAAGGAADDQFGFWVAIEGDAWHDHLGRDSQGWKSVYPDVNYDWEP